MFGEAGRRDMAVESGVIAEGSINKVLEGKQYNRAVRLHKYRIDVVLDVYRNQSIKNAEHVSRGSQDGVKFKTIRSGHRI